MMTIKFILINIKIHSNLEESKHHFEKPSYKSDSSVLLTTD